MTRQKSNLDAITFIPYLTDDTWIRDFGPLSAINEDNSTLLDFTFDGWGHKYAATKDNDFNHHLKTIAPFSKANWHTIPITLEGGSIEYNGEGILLTTQNCLSKRNNQNQIDAESILKKLFNLHSIYSLHNSWLAGDDTDGHVDNLARFLNSRTLCYISCDDASDPHYPVFKALGKEILALKDSHDRLFDCIPIPLPAPQYHDGKRLAASHLNFLITNELILVPTFNSHTDEKVLSILQALSPTRKVMGIDSRMMIRQGGGIHCASMQIAKIQ